MLLSDRVVTVSKDLCTSILYPNAIGDVTNNFIGQLHLLVRVNFMLYLVGNIDLK